jgi:hypothetical protein
MRKSRFSWGPVLIVAFIAVLTIAGCRTRAAAREESAKTEAASSPTPSRPIGGHIASAATHRISICSDAGRLPLCRLSTPNTASRLIDSLARDSVHQGRYIPTTPRKGALETAASNLSFNKWVVHVSASLRIGPPCEDCTRLRSYSEMCADVFSVDDVRPGSVRRG